MCRLFSTLLYFRHCWVYSIISCNLCIDAETLGKNWLVKLFKALTERPAHPPSKSNGSVYARFKPSQNHQSQGSNSHSLNPFNLFPQNEKVQVQELVNHFYFSFGRLETKPRPATFVLGYHDEQCLQGRDFWHHQEVLVQLSFRNQFAPYSSWSQI